MQGVLSESEGHIELVKGFNYEQGLKDLEGFDRIWLLYAFHRNTSWKPLTNPPYSDGRGRKGVFATRSPYRPNSLGLSCVELKRISGNLVHVAGSDLLNDTPILDIKPYIREFDSFPEARRGWLENVVKEKYSIDFSESAARQLAFLGGFGVDLDGVIDTQLGHNPFDPTRNKFIRCEDGGILRFRSWRIHFRCDERRITVYCIKSGYESFDRLLGDDSPADQAVHREFCRQFP